MIAIRAEIDRGRGDWPRGSSLRNAPHTAERRGRPTTGSTPTPASEAAFPVPGLRRQKYWPPVRRIDGAYGDRNLVCSCPPVEAYA